jgi:DNA (cytosine-5)-methyltransferase 1
MTHGSLFSGIGGFDLAAEWMGWDNIFHCEWNKFGQKVLKYYFPKSISYEDINKTDFTIHRGTIDILTGGFPCQPYSLAGKRLGKEDDRHLWPEMLRAIREIQPRWVVGENVRGFTNWNGGMVFDEVQSDLEAEGYEVTPFLLPACAVNAPHRRDRIWFVAKNTKCNGCIQRESKQEGAKIWEQRNISSRSSNRIHISERDAAYTYNEGLQGCENLGNIAEIRKKSDKFTARRIPPTWQNFPTQYPICIGDDGFSSRLDGITFSKWRNESIKAAGNAIVPQVVFQIFKAIQQYEIIHSPSNTAGA